MKSWKEVRGAIWTEATAALAFRPMPDWLRGVPTSQWPDKLEEAERSTRAELDVCVRLFSRAETWPPGLTDAEAFFLGQRLVVADLVLKALGTARSEGPLPFPTPPAAVEDEAWIEWLLIDCWRTAGLEWWKGLLRTARWFRPA